MILISHAIRVKAANIHRNKLPLRGLRQDCPYRLVFVQNFGAGYYSSCLHYLFFRPCLSDQGEPQFCFLVTWHWANKTSAHALYSLYRTFHLQLQQTHATILLLTQHHCLPMYTVHAKVNFLYYDSYELFQIFVNVAQLKELKITIPV